MEKGNFKDRPNATRLALSIGKVNFDIDIDTVQQFLNFQYSYREMQRKSKRTKLKVPLPLL